MRLAASPDAGSAGRSGWGAPPDPLDHAAEAEAHYLRVCRLRRMSVSELRALLAGDPFKAAPWVDSAARHGLPEAQLHLGQMLLDGAGVARDAVSALAWFTRAARKGAPEAMNMVGRCYENGWGAPIDLATAARWYRSSADAGHDWGKYNYANMLFDGRGVVRDSAEAVVWYRRAAEQGHARAMNLLARCHEEGWGVERDRVDAAFWYRRSAEHGYFRGQFNHATILTGQGNLDDALTWFQRAFEAATSEGSEGMAEALVRHPNPHLAELGRQRAERL